MPEGRKMVQSSPASAGAGDISERELSRERGNLLTPPARLQRVHPKRQFFSTPVNKFTAKAALPSPNLARIRTCLDELRETPARPVKISPKAVSMEDLTPNKRIRREGSDNPVPCVALRGRERAALRIGVFLLTAAWRRRRDELRCARTTLALQVRGAERLRVQVCALKALLAADGAKLRLALRELQRLKLLLRDSDAEKASLEKEKCALEQDLSASEDRASEMSVGWRESRAQLEAARHALAREAAARRAALRDAGRARRTIESLEAELSQREALAARGEEDAAALRRQLAAAAADLRALRLARARAEQRCAELSGELERVRRRWLPAPLHRLASAARACLPRSLAAAALWALAPARHGC